MNARTIVLVTIGNRGAAVPEIIEATHAIGIPFVSTYESILDLIKRDEIQFKGELLHVVSRD